MTKKYVLVGASARALFMYAKPLRKNYTDGAEIVGIFDINRLRAEIVREKANLTCPVYTDFETMLRESRPDAAIITTIDSWHHYYVIKSLEAGLDAIVEKPMTIDAEKCLAMLEAEQRTGKKISVTFNARFTLYYQRAMELIKEGAIGRVLSIDFVELLDTRHGADYFRRWHRQKANSGGLLITKATHHFDLTNWWIGDEPETVMAFGSRSFYTPDRKQRGERCLTCQFKQSCRFYFDVEYYREEDDSNVEKELYFNVESGDGYIRDRCIFADEIDIEDTISVNVRYRKGVLLTYSLNAHSPYEAVKVAINGTEGRLEVIENKRGIVTLDPCEILLYNRKCEKVRYSLPMTIGGHGGGDKGLLDMLFRDGIPDILNQRANAYDGALSILIGAAANISIKEGRPVRIDTLLPLDKFRLEK